MPACVYAQWFIAVRLLLTGGAGYIGGFCARELAASGHQVVILERRPPIDPTAPAEEVVIGDIADRALVERVLRNRAIDAVVHLAADKSVEHAHREPGAHLLNNVGGTLQLLEAMREAAVRKLVFSSSAAVYGTPTRLPVAESDPARPENAYGSSKLMCEEILRWYHQSEGFDSVSLRYFNAAGAADDGSLGENWDHADNLVPRVMRALLVEGEELTVFGDDFPTPDGTAVRDYVHVLDVAAAHESAMKWVMGNSGRLVLNVGAGRGYSVLEVIAEAERASGRKVPHTIGPRRPGDAAAVYADVQAAAEMLDWRARRDLREIVASAWEWHSGARRG
jgi:UDP-glucose-4-epimerase GalE